MKERLKVNLEVEYEDGTEHEEARMEARVPLPGVEFFYPYWRCPVCQRISRTPQDWGAPICLGTGCHILAREG